MKLLAIFLLVISISVKLEAAKKNSGKLTTRFVKIPTSLKGFNYETLLKIKQKLGENKWVRLKHLFLLNPHLPFLAFTGQDITTDDIYNWPSWLKPASGEEGQLNKTEPSFHPPLAKAFYLRRLQSTKCRQCER